MRGAALLLLLIFFMLGSLIVVLGMGRTAYYDVMRYRTLKDSKQVYYAAESGAMDILYRLRKAHTTSATENLTVAGATVTTTRVMVVDVVTVVASALKSGLHRTVQGVMVLGGGASFNFGLQSHTGGIDLANSAAVYGNVYSNGSVTGSNNMIYGDVVSAGAGGLVSGIHATGSAYAHTIQSSTIDKNAFYFATSTLIGTTVLGTKFPESPDQPVQDLPIDDATIEEWKQAAEDGGVLPLASCSGGVSTGTYTIGSSTSIGPLKIPCNLHVQGNGTTLSLTGPLWVEGTLSTANGPEIRVDSGSNRSVYVVVDNPADRLTSSKIDIKGSTGFLGGGGTSYVLLVSMNNSSSGGGSEVAIDIDNNTPAGEEDVIYYAPYGELLGRNSLQLRGATADQISLANSASVYYETGMISLLFTGGAGGSYVMDSWREVE